jgi:hypothetical protein
MTGPIPPNPLADPAEKFKDKLGSIRQQLTNLGVDQGIADNILGEVSSKINTTLPDIPSTVNGDFNNILSALSATGIGFKPETNILDGYSSYTYHIKFCVTSDSISKQINTHADWDKVPKEVIAESGTTVGFNIRNMEIKNLCSPQSRIGIAVETTWTMTLVEPYGLSLVDRLYSLAKDKFGIQNHLKCCYFIEVWFQGYDESGIQTPIDIKKLYRVLITDITVDSTTSGSIYNITGVMDGSLATSNEFTFSGQHLKIQDVKTFGEFWDRFKTTMNEQMKKLDYDFETKRVEYDFIFPKEWRAWALKRNPTDNPSQSGFSVTGTDAPTIQIPRGKSIEQVLQTVMSICEDGKKFIAGPLAAGKDAGKTSSRAESEGISLIPFIESKVEFISYNYLYQDYVKKITYYFKPYPTVRSFRDRTFIDNSQKKDVQKQRITEFVNSARLKKIYYFQFTGLNTDVLKFDIKLDAYWAALQPMFDGVNSSTLFQLPQSVPGESLTQTLRNEYLKNKQAVDEAKVNLETLTNSDTFKKLGNYQKALTEAQTALSTAQEKFQTFASKINISDFEIKFATGSAGEQAIAGITISNPTLLKDKIVQQDIVNRLVYTLTRSAAKDRYLEQISPQVADTNPLLISSTISKAPSIQDNNTGGLGTAESINVNSSGAPKSRGLLATILNNVTGPQFVNIELEIRGDPYWMGFDNIENLQYLSPDTPPSPQTGKASALFGTGECAFLLYFRTGEEPNEATGLVQFNTASWAFNGMYVVLEVDNHFNDGKFTQTLHAVKDVAMYSIFNQTPADLLAAGQIPV